MQGPVATRMQSKHDTSHTTALDTSKVCVYRDGRTPGPDVHGKADDVVTQGNYRQHTPPSEFKETSVETDIRMLPKLLTPRKQRSNPKLTHHRRRVGIDTAKLPRTHSCFDPD